MIGIVHQHCYDERRTYDEADEERQQYWQQIKITIMTKTLNYIDANTVFLHLIS